jgi:hypothetical protein
MSELVSTKMLDWLTIQPSLKRATALLKIIYQTPTGALNQEIKPLIEGIQFDEMYNLPITVLGIETNLGGLLEFLVAKKIKESVADYPIDPIFESNFNAALEKLKEAQKEPESIALMEIVDKMVEVRKEG